MEKALEQAMMRRGFCAPNPAVGAVLVREQNILALGTHWASGQAHAEVDALEKLEGSARGATLFVTLEPCCHWGKTPPCTQRIIEAGISHVYYGFLDPNPDVAGQGVQQLKEAGIQCEPCFLPSIADFYESYRYWRAHQQPRVTAKLAVSCDGKIAGKAGKPVHITGDALQQLTHEYRQKSDAILTTIETVLHDDPQLNVRLAGEVQAKSVYVLDTHLRLPVSANLIKTSEKLIVLHGQEVNEARRLALEAVGVRCVSIEAAEMGLSLSEVLSFVGKEGVHDLWVEAGGRCVHAFCQGRWLHRALIYMAPKILGEAALGLPFRLMDVLASAQSVEWVSYGEDLVCDLIFQ